MQAGRSLIIPLYLFCAFVPTNKGLVRATFLLVPQELGSLARSNVSIQKLCNELKWFTARVIATHVTPTNSYRFCDLLSLLPQLHRDTDRRNMTFVICVFQRSFRKCTSFFR